MKKTKTTNSKTVNTKTTTKATNTRTTNSKATGTKTKETQLNTVKPKAAASKRAKGKHTKLQNAKTKGAQSKKKVINTPYDDVFRTLLNDCSDLIIPLINEVFGEHYTGDEKITFSPNEHFLNRQDGNESERITDSSFRIEDREGRISRKYHLECQSRPDNSMLIRFYEYDTQIALDEGKLQDNVLTVTLPCSALLLLRHPDPAPDRLTIRMLTPGGNVEYDILVIKSQRYTLEEIFEKNLLLLIPFYIFSHEKRFKKYEKDGAELEALQAEYAQIRKRLEELTERGFISEYTKCTLVDMSNKVLDNIAGKFDSVKEGVKTVMGGKVLEHEAKTILKKGIAQGETIGMEKGLKQGEARGMEKGLKQGEAMGLEKGIPQGEEKLSRLIEKLMKDDRQQDVLKVTQDKEFRKKLYHEYSID